MIYEVRFMICDLEDKNGSVRRVSRASLAEAIRVRCRKWRFCAKNPDRQFRLVGHSGLLVWRPEQCGFGGDAPCVFGTWHVAVWIFGPKTRVPCRRAGVSVESPRRVGVHRKT